MAEETVVETRSPGGGSLGHTGKGLAGGGSQAEMVGKLSWSDRERHGEGLMETGYV